MASNRLGNNLLQGLVVNLQKTAIKRQFRHTIKVGDLHLLKKMVALFNIVPNEEISEGDRAWTCLHYACCKDACILLDYLLQLTYELYKEDYNQIVNIKTSEGWNLVMLTAIYGSTNSLQLLLKYGGIKLYDKDNNGLRATDLALKYKKESVYKILTKQVDHFPMKTITEPAEFMTPLNISELEKNEEQIESFLNNVEGLKIKEVDEEEKYQGLFQKGKRLPCVVCAGDKGWLKYSDCCGHPIHPLCVKGIKRCPQCSSSGLCLVSTIKFPEKAFTLEVTNDSQ